MYIGETMRDDWSQSKAFVVVTHEFDDLCCGMFCLSIKHWSWQWTGVDNTVLTTNLVCE